MILATISDGMHFLMQQSATGLLALFWFTAIFELPRYAFGFLAIVLSKTERNLPSHSGSPRLRTSVIIAGHNEADAIERCVLALREQSLPPDEIIVVSDGSRDAMPARMRDLQSRGLIDQAHCTDLRAGKAAAVNLGERFATGDIIIVVDCDCSYDRHALRQIVEPFCDPEVGSVSGNILVRNPRASVIATFQALEYLISISLGKQASDLLGQVACVSGAFGAFRRRALDDIGGQDAGGGEDFDLTLRLRKAGWQIRFAEDAISYTDVPTSLTALIKQRFRWERDAIRLRYRKHVDLINPFSTKFQTRELVHELEFLVFNILSTMVLPFYLIWLFVTYGDLALAILLAMQVGLMLLDLAAFVFAALTTPHARTLPLLLYVPGYSLFNGLVMRLVRAGAYLQEWIFNASVADTYVPAKVQILRRW